jgi:hypothetical protein
MSNLFAGVYGAKFPEVVMNSGPLPPEGGLPAPLHDTPDARINYGATLLGDLQPYAYGEAGYMSSQSQNNQPHRIQKIIPELYLPEPNGRDVFKLSHAVDDSDLAFVMRLNRNSIFCTGSRTSTRRNTKIGTTVDPIINLATLNYLLAGLQIGRPDLPGDGSSLWWEFLHNLDPRYWPKEGMGRNYSADTERLNVPKNLQDAKPGFFNTWIPVFKDKPFGLDDLVHIIRHCIKPFGIVRGSERQGGQHEMSSGAATWTTSAISTLVIDGKEANVVNIWHHEDIHAGDDLVLRLKIMPVKTYTLNHYFKGFARKSFEVPSGSCVWQLVPDIFGLTLEKEYSFIGIQDKDEYGAVARKLFESFRNLYINFDGVKDRDNDDVGRRMNHILSLFTLTARIPVLTTDGKTNLPFLKYIHVLHNLLYHDPHYQFPWQQLGFWHIGRAQVMRKRYGDSVFYNDDMANTLKTNHIDMTFQPSFSCLPTIPFISGFVNSLTMTPFTMVGQTASVAEEKWAPDLRLEQMHTSQWNHDPEPPLKRVHTGMDDSCLLDTEIYPASCFYSSVVYADSDSPGFFKSDVCVQDSIVTASDSAGVMLEASAGPGQGTTAGASLSTGSVESSRGELASEMAAGQDAGISEGSRAELLAGLSAPKKTGRGPNKARRGTEPGGTSRGPVDGTLLRPGAEPEACRMELL